jgi:uncharacterized protein (TIGR03435 family)
MRFDVTATAGLRASGDTVREMLRGLLRDRFGLVVHAETREMPIYVLKIARADGTLGPNLRRSSTDCSGRPSNVVAGRVQCGILVSPGQTTASLRGGGVTIANFVRLFGDFLDRPLNDATGLDGVFDFEFQFSVGLPAATTPDDLPPVSTAIHEQMGLKLDAQKGRADVWVIDAASQPTAN